MYYFYIILSKQLVLFVRHPAKGAPLYFRICIFVTGISAFKNFKNKRLYTLYSRRAHWLFQDTPGGQLSPSQKRNVALIIPGGYCSCIALGCWHVQSLGTSCCNNHISTPLPSEKRWHTLMPGMA